MHSAVKEVPMSKKVLILSGSPRKGGNSDILCDEFLRGAQDAGHKAEKIRVAEKKVASCSGCYYCSTLSFYHVTVTNKRILEIKCNKNYRAFILEAIL